MGILSFILRLLPLIVHDAFDIMMAIREQKKEKQNNLNLPKNE